MASVAWLARPDSRAAQLTRRTVQITRRQFFLGLPRDAFKLEIRPLVGAHTMENIAPAISAPSGIGVNKPANQAVLNWVREVESLTQPENIFWCDGSEAEND